MIPVIFRVRLADRVDGLTDKEDNGRQPVISEDEGDDEEGDAEHDGHACSIFSFRTCSSLTRLTSDEMNEVFNFARNRRHVRVETRCEMSDASHECAIARAHNDSLRSACDVIALAHFTLQVVYLQQRW